MSLLCPNIFKKRSLKTRDKIESFYTLKKIYQLCADAEKKEYGENCIWKYLVLKTDLYDRKIKILEKKYRKIKPG